jgi:hypothetical protein
MIEKPKTVTEIKNMQPQFTIADTLKAERIKAILECAQKAVDITNDAEVGNEILKLLDN